MPEPRYSVVVPVYKNRETLPALLDRLDALSGSVAGHVEIVFVVDGSPDDSHAYLTGALPGRPFASQLIELSRNFGAFAAIRAGILHANGTFIAVMAADLQEPPELVARFFELLETGSTDVAVGRREGRDDPLSSRLSSGLFWRAYRKWIFPDMPEGGVDIFACNREVAKELLALDESHSSFVGLLYWIGFRRVEVPYRRQQRADGSSGWTLRKKLAYLLDSVFSFTALPLNILIGIGVFGGIFTIAAAIFVLISYLGGSIREPGYTPLMLVVLFSTFSILLALGIVGSYVWRAFENTKRRPGAIVMSKWGSDEAE